MKCFKVLFYFSIMMLANNSLAQNLEYYTIDQFKNKYPKQVKLMNNFSKIVRSDVIPVKSKKKVSVTFVYPGHQISDYWRRSIDSFRKRMVRLESITKLKKHLQKLKS